MTKYFILAQFVCIFAVSLGYLDQNEEKLPSKCHVCKHMTRELAEELGRSDKSHDVLYMGQLFQKEPKKVPYKQSELRLTEALENACSNVLEYKVHKDKPLAFRYEKVESTTFKTLKGLKNRGVKVDLGFPDQMWDTPDAEVTRLKSKCEQMVERYEDEITHWYYQLIDTNLTRWLCVGKVLQPSEHDCLNETATKDENEQEKGTKNVNKKDFQADKQSEKVTKKMSENKSIKEKEMDSRMNEQRDKEKIERLIRQQADEQLRPRFSSDRFRRSDEWRQTGGMSQPKRSALRDRLRSINDPDRLRREIRKIRNSELKKIGSSDGDIPEDTRRGKREYDRFDDVVDFRREIETRVVDLERKNDVMESAAFQKMLRLYQKDAKEIRDKNELLKRLQDLDALSDIIGDVEMHDEL